MKKALLCVLLFIVAAFATVTVKDYLDMQNPIYVVPQITVYADETEVPTTLSGYSWRFGLDKEISELPASIADVSFPGTTLLGGEKLDIEFSRTPKTVMISRSDPYSYSFKTVDGELSVPFEHGGYIYKVYAVFDKGTALYLFYIEV